MALGLQITQMSLFILSLTWRLKGCFYSQIGEESIHGSGSQKNFLDFFIEAHRATPSNSGWQKRFLNIFFQIFNRDPMGERWLGLRLHFGDE